MTIYDRAQALAARQLAAKGQLGAIRRDRRLGSSPTEIAPALRHVVDYPARFALFPVDQKDVDGTFIKSGDWRVILSGQEPADAADWLSLELTESIATITPETGDILVTSEGNLTVVDAGKFAPAGTVTHYSMVARK